MTQFTGWTTYKWTPQWEHGREREIHVDVAARIFHNWYDDPLSDAITPRNGHSYHAGYLLRVSESTQVEVLPIR